jgi:hypothetical protein
LLFWIFSSISSSSSNNIIVNTVDDKGAWSEAAIRSETTATQTQEEKQQIDEAHTYIHTYKQKRGIREAGCRMPSVGSLLRGHHLVGSETDTNTGNIGSREAHAREREFPGREETSDREKEGTRRTRGR